MCSERINFLQTISKFENEQNVLDKEKLITISKG